VLGGRVCFSEGKPATRGIGRGYVIPRGNRATVWAAAPKIAPLAGGLVGRLEGWLTVG